MKLIKATAVILTLGQCLVHSDEPKSQSLSRPPATASPSIVNIYNFIRNTDWRLENSEDVLFDATERQMSCLKQAGLPATWALQYDALINPRYQKLLKEQIGAKDEIAAWWEIPRQLAEKVGLRWRGEHDWDPVANVGFSPGYTPEERRKLVDAYMAEFKTVFGFYPRTVGSWFIDEVTLTHMVDRYGIVASCNCKDQIGTDFYTLWGGYWNQAYYPSRVNSYMPAQTKGGQIDVPIFRMLGSDPIYQHGTTPGLISLEPVYIQGGGGGSPKWVTWFMNSLVEQPSLAFAYTQAGQENSFGWKAMEGGFTNQVALLAAMAKAGTVRIETLEASGKWFKKNFPLTPATSVVALDDWKNEGRKTVWYDSRFYRMNLLWENDGFFIRDIHCFDEHIVSPTHLAPLKETSLTYETLPIVDWASWSDSGKNRAGMWPMLLEPDGSTSPMPPDGKPVVKELNSTDLRIEQRLRGGGVLSIVCGEREITVRGTHPNGKPLKWAFEIAGGERFKTNIRGADATGVHYHHAGVDYSLSLGSRKSMAHRSDDGTVRLIPDQAGKLVLRFKVSHAETTELPAKK
jgi:hypothetical protein